MRVITLFVIFATCLFSEPSAKALSGASMNPTIPTPQQQAITKQIFQLKADADTALNVGDYASAEADARKALSLGWEGSICQGELADALYAEGKNLDALQSYKTLADEGSDQPQVLMPYALLLIKTGQYSQAVIAYNKAISTYDTRDLANVRGAFFTEVPQSAELEAACHIELGRVFSNKSAYASNSQDYKRMYSKALDQYEQALQFSPNNALAHYCAGKALEHLGLKPEALVAYSKAAKFGDGDIRKAAEDALAGR